jgi:gamma-glutamyltranspeptidase/glutathione hydrolase
MLQCLQLFNTFAAPELDAATVGGIHHIVETMKLSLADRDAYYGDVRHVNGAFLTSREYATSQKSRISGRAAQDRSPGTVPGMTAPFTPPIVEIDADAMAAATTGEPTVRVTGETRGDTCHINVVDRWGNMISATPSGGWLQSSPLIPDLGFALSTRLQMTWLDARAPSALRPGRRPRTTLSPTLVTDHGKPIMGLGTPGGDQQDQWQLLYLLRYLVGGFEPQEAADAPVFHTTAATSSFHPRGRTPGGLVIEDRYPEAILDGLVEAGHKVTVAADWTLGRVAAVHASPENGELSASSNARGMHNYAAGR